MRQSRNILRALLIGPFIAGTAMAGPLDDVAKNQLPALASFDYAQELLGLAYGIDPAFPTFTANGTISSGGFSWTSTGTTYLGSPVDWTASGSFNPATNSIHWSGDGTYLGLTWSLLGDVTWLSDADFQIAHDYSILDPLGQSRIFTSTPDGAPAFDAGTFADQPTTFTYTVPNSKTTSILFGLFKSTESDTQTITISAGTIFEDTVTVTNDTTKAGVQVTGGGGTLDSGGGSFSKKTTIRPVPEPSTITVLLPAVAAIFAVLWKANRKREGTARA